MKYQFSLLLFEERFGEENINVTIYAKNASNAWNKLYYQLNKSKLFNNVVSIYMIDLNF